MVGQLTRGFESRPVRLNAFFGGGVLPLSLTVDHSARRALGVGSGTITIADVEEYVSERVRLGANDYLIKPNSGNHFAELALKLHAMWLTQTAT